MDARIGGDHARQALSENLGPRLGLAWCLSSAYILPFWLLPFRSPFPLAAIEATRKCQRRVNASASANIGVTVGAKAKTRAKKTATANAKAHTAATTKANISKEEIAMKNSINTCNKSVWCGAMSFLGDQVG